MNQQNVVGDIARELGLRIVRGELPARARLPAVRTLAAEFGVNVSTVQRVLVQLEERGLVVARARSGVEVRDVESLGVSSVWPLVMHDAARQPARALALLRDGLRCRRVLALDLVEDLRRDPGPFTETLGALVAGFEVALSGSAVTDVDVFDAENRVLRGLLLGAQRPAVLAVFNEVQRMIRANDLLLAVIYSDRRATLGLWRSLLMVIEDRQIDVAVVAAGLLAFDERIEAEFESRLRGVA